MTETTIEPQVSLPTPRKRSKPPVSENRIVFYRGQEAFEIPVEYDPLSGERLPPLVFEMAGAMWALAACQHRAALGEAPVGNGGVDLAFETQEAEGRFTRAYRRATYFLRGE